MQIETIKYTLFESIWPTTDASPFSFFISCFGFPGLEQLTAYKRHENSLMKLNQNVLQRHSRWHSTSQVALKVIVNARS